MPTTAVLRVPAWLAGSTIALMIAAAGRVAEVQGLAGVIEFGQLLVLVALSACVLLVAERHEAHLADMYWPSPKVRKLVVLALLVFLDCYMAAIVLRGDTFAGAVGI